MAAVAGLALFVSACGDTAGPTAPTTEAPAATPAPGPAATDARPQGPAAPDFELALGTGGSFSLSAEQKPVYMVFWAEW